MDQEYSNQNKEQQHNYSNIYNQNNIMPEEHNLQTTKTFGKTLEEREFTSEEKVVLLHFFTNIDKNIYAATDNMPNTLWALLEGGYSRAQESMRMRFLKIFDDMQADLEKGKLHSDEIVSVKDFADKINQGDSLNLSFFLKKAEKFMRKWAVQYGHDSLKDSDVLRFAIENVTQLATVPIEEARLGAYQEKSTRYVPFSRDSLIVPTDLKHFEKEIREWNNLLIDSYEKSKVTVSNFIKTKLDSSTFKSEAAFERTVNAKTFDVIRYFLPATILTSLGVVWPTREAERHISKLISDEREEIRSIGYTLLEEGKKISPGLLNHVSVNKYQQDRNDKITKILSTLRLEKIPPTIDRQDNAMTLVSIDKDSEAKIAAAILFEHNQEGHSFMHYFKLCKQIPLIIEPIITAYLKDRGNFDALPIATELGSMLFEITMDYGGYRDLKRHRRNLLLTAPLTVELGYEYPEYVANEPALIEVKQMIDYCDKKTKELFEKVKITHPHLASYIVMFIHKQQYLWQMDPRQLAYVTELRSTPAGHWSYRDIAQKMFLAVQPTLPTLCKFMRVDMTLGEEGRKKQEEKTVEKLRAIGGDLHKVS